MAKARKKKFRKKRRVKPHDPLANIPDKATGRFFVTGKRWRTIFIGTFSEQRP